MKLTSFLFTSLVVLAAPVTLWAEDSHHTQPAPEAAAPAPAPPGMMPMMPEMMGMMQKMGIMQEMMDPTRHVEGRIAFLHAELAITEAQEPLWTPLADALRQNAAGMAGAAPTDHGHVSSSVVGRLLDRQQALETQLAGLRAVNAALKPLAEVLTEDQRGKLDELFPHVSGIMAMGGMMPLVGMMPTTAMSDIATPALGATAALASGSGYVFSANEAAHSLSRIDLSSGQVETFPLPLVPHNVDVMRKGQPLLVVGPAAGHGSADMAGMEGHAEAGLLAVLDPLDPAKTPAALIEVGEHPAHVVALADGSTAFVSNAGEATVGVIDLKVGQMVARIPTGAYPHGLRLSPDESSLLVANVEDGSVSLIDVASRTETARIPVGKTPVQVGFLPDGGRAYVSLRDEDAVAVIDLAERKVTTRIPVGRGPIQLHASADGRYVFVANQGTAADPDNRVSVIEVATDAVVATIETGMAAHGVDISDDGKSVFVTNVADGTISEIDIATLKVTATHRVADGPNGVAYLQP